MEPSYCAALLFARVIPPIDRFYEREPDLSVSDVLAALDEVSMALACKRARTHWSRANVVRMSDYRHSI